MDEEMRPVEEMAEPSQPVEIKEETSAEPVQESTPEEVVPEAMSCGCSVSESKNTEDMIRDLVNLINVYKEEEKEGVSTRIDQTTAEELVAKLKEIAEKVGVICKC